MSARPFFMKLAAFFSAFGAAVALAAVADDRKPEVFPDGARRGRRAARDSQRSSHHDSNEADDGTDSRNPPTAQAVPRLPPRRGPDARRLQRPARRAGLVSQFRRIVTARPRPW